MYEKLGCNPTIISEEVFKKVKDEKAKRTNIIIDDDGTVRKSTHYSSKKKSEK